MASIVVTEGSTWSRQYTLTDSETGDPIDVTDADITISLYYQGRTNYVLEKTIDNSGVTVVGDPADGVVELSISADDTEDHPGPYSAEIKVVQSDLSVFKAELSPIFVTSMLI